MTCIPAFHECTQAACSVFILPLFLVSSLSEEGVFGKESTSKLSVKQLEKLAQRLIKRYNLPLNDFPHISVMNSRKAFHYILFQRYKMKQISDTNMDELLRVCVLCVCVCVFVSVCGTYVCVYTMHCVCMCVGAQYH